MEIPKILYNRLIEKYKLIDKIDINKLPNEVDLNNYNKISTENFIKLVNKNN